MLQSGIASRSRTTVGAVGSSDKPFSCGQTCPFFEQGACNKSTYPGPATRFGRSQPIYSEGDHASHCYKVVEGAVRLSRILNDGHRQILNIFLPGDTFGIELAQSYHANAEAVGEVVVLKCPRICIDRRTESDHRRGMLDMLSRSLAAAQDHVAMLGHQGARERVASFLVRLAQTQNRADNQAVDIPVGRQDMADYLGLTIETTCRTLSDLKATGVIAAPNRHQIIIRNRARLAAIIDGNT